MHNSRFFFGGPHKNNLYIKLTHALIYLLFVWYFLTGKERIPKSLDVNNFESPRSFVLSIWQKKATSNKFVKLSVHWDINPFLKNTTSLFLAKPPPPLNQQLSKPPFLENTPSILVFCEPPPSKLDFSVNLQNIKVFHPYYHLIS